jgi:bifunctional DNase/RNase
MHPILDGEFCVHKGEGDVRGLMMGTGESGGSRSLMTLWMRQDDLDAIVCGLTRGRSAHTAKGRALDSAVEVLSALGTEIVRVVLRSSGAWRCRADMELRQGASQITLDLRPSDAMGLAVRAKVPIYAEEPVIRDGNVGEDDVPVPEEHMDSKAYRTELGSQHQVDALRDKAFEMGLSPEEMVDTVRCHVDEADGVVRLWIETFLDKEWAFSLEEYRPGVQKLFELARGQSSSGIIRAGTPYKVSYSMLGEDARMRIVPDTGDPQAEWGVLGPK